MSFDLIVRDATLPDGRTGLDIAIRDGRIAAIERGIRGEAGRDRRGRRPPGQPAFRRRAFPHGRDTLARAAPAQPIRHPARRHRPLGRAEAASHGRGGDGARCAVATSPCRRAFSRSAPVDVCDDGLLAVDALLDVKKQVAPYLDLQLVAFPQDGYYRSPGRSRTSRARSTRAWTSWAASHFERTMTDGAASVRALCEIAAERGLRVDMHCDETDDPLSRHIETLAYESRRLGLHGRVAGSHLTSMHSMDNTTSRSSCPSWPRRRWRHREPARQRGDPGRHDTYPKRRGMTRIPEMRSHGILCAFGQDC